MMSRPTYRASERYPLVASAMAVGTLLAMGLALTFMLASVLQWRSDVRTQAEAADASRQAIAHSIEVGSLR